MITTPLQTILPSGCCWQGWVKLWTLIATQREGTTNLDGRTCIHPVAASRLRSPIPAVALLLLPDFLNWQSRIPQSHRQRDTIL